MCFQDKYRKAASRHQDADGMDRLFIIFQLQNNKFLIKGNLSLGEIRQVRNHQEVLQKTDPGKHNKQDTHTHMKSTRPHRLLH